MFFISADTLRLHIAYTTWATNRLMDAAAKLTLEERTRHFGSSEKSVAGTLAHIYAADRVWMGRIQGVNPKLYVNDEDRDLVVLSRAWPALLKQWKMWAGALTDESVHNKIDYTNPKGNPDRTPNGKLFCTWLIMERTIVAKFPDSCAPWAKCQRRST
jgi:uncharacterized damage-inducible protein DinB